MILQRTCGTNDPCTREAQFTVWEALEPFLSKDMSEHNVTLHLESKPGVDENFKISLLMAPH